MTHMSPSALLAQLDGATIVASYVEDEEGMHLCFEDGRILVIAGMFAVSLQRIDRDRLH